MAYHMVATGAWPHVRGVGGVREHTSEQWEAPWNRQAGSSSKRIYCYHVAATQAHQPATALSCG